MEPFDGVYDIEIDFQDSDFTLGSLGTETTTLSKETKDRRIGAKGSMTRFFHGSTEGGTPVVSEMQCVSETDGSVHPTDSSRSKDRTEATKSRSDSDVSEPNDAKSSLDFYCAEIRRLKRLKSQDENRLQISLADCSETLVGAIAKFPGSAQLILESQKEPASSNRSRQSSRKRKAVEKRDATPDSFFDGLAVMEVDDDDGIGEHASRSASIEGSVDSECVETLRICFSEFRESVRKHGIAHKTTLEYRKRLTDSFRSLSLTPLAITTLVKRMESLLASGADLEKYGIQGQPHSPSVAHLEFEQMHGVRFDEFKRIVHEATSLFREWQKVRNRVAEYHVGLVVYLARQYSSEPQELIDLIQEGNIGLLKAVERFNYRLGFRFSTYATYWIRLAMSRYLARSSRAVRLPYRQNLHIGTVRKKRQSFEQRHGRAPSTLELARNTGISETGLRKLEVMSQAVTSLDSQLESGEGLDLMSLLEQQTFSPPAEVVESKKLTGLIEKAIDGLNQREAYVIRERFGIGVYAEKTLQELGSILGLTRERVRQIENGALKKIRRWLEPLAV